MIASGDLAAVKVVKVEPGKITNILLQYDTSLSSMFCRCSQGKMEEPILWLLPANGKYHGIQIDV